MSRWKHIPGGDDYQRGNYRLFDDRDGTWYLTRKGRHLGNVRTRREANWMIRRDRFQRHWAWVFMLSVAGVAWGIWG